MHNFLSVFLNFLHTLCARVRGLKRPALRVRQTIPDATNLPKNIAGHPALYLELDVDLRIVQQLLVHGEHVAVDVGLQVVQPWVVG